MGTQELDVVITVDEAVEAAEPLPRGIDDGLEPQLQKQFQHEVVTEKQSKSRLEWLDFRPGGVLTINDKDADASCIFFWLYAAAFAVGLVCLFVGYDRAPYLSDLSSIDECLSLFPCFYRCYTRILSNLHRLFAPASMPPP